MSGVSGLQLFYRFIFNVWFDEVNVFSDATRGGSGAWNFNWTAIEFDVVGRRGHYRETMLGG